MALRVIQGPPNSGKAGEVLTRFRAALEREPVLVVPTADDVAAFERELCAGGAATLGGSIVTFGGLYFEVGRRLGVELPPVLTGSQRQALVRAAIRRAAPRHLGRSASRPGFAPALDALIAELQEALVGPGEFAGLVAELEDAALEAELADVYAAYVDLREASERADAGLVAQRTIAALRGDSQGWGERPVLLYGFDDLGRAQVELVAELARAAEVTVAVDYADRRALAVRAALVSTLTEELGAGHLTLRTPIAPRCATSIATCSSRARSRSSPTRGSRCSPRPAPAERRRRSGSRSRACSNPGMSPTRSRSWCGGRSRPGRCWPASCASSACRSRSRRSYRSPRRASGAR